MAIAASIVSALKSLFFSHFIAGFFRRYTYLAKFLFLNCSGDFFLFKQINLLLISALSHRESVFKLFLISIISLSLCFVAADQMETGRTRAPKEYDAMGYLRAQEEQT